MRGGGENLITRFRLEIFNFEKEGMFLALGLDGSLKYIPVRGYLVWTEG